MTWSSSEPHAYTCFPVLLPLHHRYDYVAAKAGVVLVPSCGFDSVPADLTVYLSNKTLKAAAGPHASLGDSLTVYRANGGISGGTLASALALAENITLEKLNEANADYALCPGASLNSTAYSESANGAS